jgi:hypothetical protein
VERREIVESRIPWPRGKFWRPGEPITLSEDGVAVTYLLRAVVRDADPGSTHATVHLEPVRTLAEDGRPVSDEDVASAAS